MLPMKKQVPSPPLRTITKIKLNVQDSLTSLLLPSLMQMMLVSGCLLSMQQTINRAETIAAEALFVQQRTAACHT